MSVSLLLFILAFIGVIVVFITCISMCVQKSNNDYNDNEDKL